jgi:hypothetical protein
MVHTLVESEAFVRAFSPGSTLEQGLKAFLSTWPEMLAVVGPPLVPVRITNRDKRGIPTARSGNN